MKNLVFPIALVATCTAFADADVLNRPAGIKVGERLTLRPYVCFSYTYDSNQDTEKDGKGASYWSANPGVGIDYQGENWNVSGSAYYQYHASLSGRSDSLNNSSYGEQLGFHWSSTGEDGSSWSAMISERYQVINQNDDMRYSDGKGLWRDRQQFDVNAAFSRRFNERWHASINAGFYWMDYANDKKAFAPLYGWSRWSVGAQMGYTISPWADLFLSGNYAGYGQDNTGVYADGISRRSNSWTVHAGFGSHLTERISYRLSAGVTGFEYGKTYDTSGFTYQGSLNWRFAETWATTLLLSSYYQPSEREYGSAHRCDSISWGLTKSLVRGKLNATFDIAYRHDTAVYTSDYAWDWDLNIITARLGLNYTINRLLSVFARGEYQTELNDGHEIDTSYDYDRWRLTLGLRFAY